MSTQLILYPQTYNGEYNSVATPVLFEYVVDGINFTSINGSASVDLSGGSLTQPWDAALLLLPPDTVNTWYRYRTTSPGTPALPTQTGNDLIFTALTTTGDNGSGVYQRLSNLDIGQGYEVTINLTAPVNAWGHISVRLFNGNNLAGSLIYYHPGPGPLTSSPIVVSFTAQSNEDVIMVSYFHNTAYTVSIDSISVKERHGTPTLVYSDLSDGQVICDLYEEEDIPLTLSIDDFKNVAEQVKSYSKDFNLPATKRNNKIFNNMFEITRSDDQLIFNPYIRTQCVLKQDGFILFEGYLRMIDVKDKEGEISYNVNLYTEVITLADILENLTLSDLDLSELAHAYNKDSIKGSWYEPSDGVGLPLLSSLSTSSFAYDPLLGVNQTNVLKYPFIDWTHQYIVGGTNPVSNNATLGLPELRSLEQAFRPCIQLKYLLDKIFADAGFTYTSSFFDTADFGKLFMDFNWGADNAPVVASSAVTLQVTSTVGIPTSFGIINNWGNAGGSIDSLFGYDSATGVFTAQHDNQGYFIAPLLAFRPPSLNVDTQLEAQIVVNGVVVSTFSTTLVGNAVVTPDLVYWATAVMTQPLSAGDQWSIQVKGDNLFSTVEYTGSTNLTSSTVVSQIANEVLLDTLRGELGQWEFLKGIFTMFNLISMADENDPKNILIEPYADIFINNTNCSATTSLNTIGQIR